MKNKQNNLDEMQEQAMLQIEKNGCWLAFWGLLGMIGLQGLMGTNFRQLLGEMVVFFGLCLYIIIGCLKKGIWDRRLMPDKKTNLRVSLISGLAVGGFYLLLVLIRGVKNPLVRWGLPIGGTLVTGLLVYGALSISVRLYLKRRAELEQE